MLFFRNKCVMDRIALVRVLCIQGIIFFTLIILGIDLRFNVYWKEMDRIAL